MTIPESMRVGPLVYRIVEIADLRDENDAYLYGICRNTRQDMLIDANLTLARKHLVLIHEALHAIEDMRGLDLSEPVVAALGTAIYELLQDNPWIGEVDP